MENLDTFSAEQSIAKQQQDNNQATVSSPISSSSTESTQSKKTNRLSATFSAIFHKSTVEGAGHSSSSETHEARQIEKGENLSRANKRMSRSISGLNLKSLLKREASAPKLPIQQVAKDVEETASESLPKEKKNVNEKISFKGSKLQLKKDTGKKGFFKTGKEIQNFCFKKSTFLAEGMTGVISTITSSKGKTIVVKQAKLTEEGANVKDLREEARKLNKIYDKMEALTGENLKKLPGVIEQPYGVNVVNLSDKAQKAIVKNLNKIDQSKLQNEESKNLSSEAILFKKKDASAEKCLELNMEEKHKASAIMLSGVQTYIKVGAFHNDIKLENFLVDFTEESKQAHTKNKGPLVLKNGGFSDHGGAIFHDEMVLADEMRPNAISLTFNCCFKEDIQAMTANADGVASKQKYKDITNGMMKMAVGAAMFKLYVAQKGQSPEEIPTAYPLNRWGLMKNTEKNNEEPVPFNRKALEENNVPEPIIAVIEGLMHPDIEKRMDIDEAQKAIERYLNSVA